MGRGSRVKGIVVEIGGDTVKLDKALQGTNKQLEGTQASLKDVERLLKLDPENTVLLQQKQKLLASAIADTEENLRQLTEANRQAVASAKNYDAWQAALEPVQAEIDKTSKQLAKLEKANREAVRAGEVNTEDYDKLQEEIKDTREHLKELKKQADTVWDQFGRPLSPEQFDSLQREIAEAEISLRDLKADAKKSLDAVENEVHDVADAMDEAGEKTSAFGDVLKAELVTESVKGVLSTLKETAEHTKDYRKIMGSLEVSSEASGYTTEENAEAYKKLYSILADEQSAATALANLQALQLPQAQLLSLIDEAIGGWARYGDSIPIDSLAESINETVKSGKVTGTFADILNWGASEGESYGQTLKDLTKLKALYNNAVENGVEVHDYHIAQIQKELGLGDVWDESVNDITDSQEKQIEKLKALLEAGKEWNNTVSGATAAEDMFNIALQQCSTEAERTDLIMRTMAEQGLSASAEKWRENNTSMVEANEASAALQEQLAKMGETVEPMLTKATEMVVTFLEWFNHLDPAMQDFLLASVVVVGGLGLLAGVVNNVSKCVDHLSGSKLPGLSGVLGKIGTKVLPGLQSAFTSVFGFIAAHPIVAGIAAVALFGDQIQDILGGVDTFLQDAFARDWTELFGPVLGGAVNNLLDVCKAFWDGFKTLLDGIIDFIRGVFTLDWERAWKGVTEVFEGIFGGILGTVRVILEKLAGLLGLEVPWPTTVVTSPDDGALPSDIVAGPDVLTAYGAAGHAGGGGSFATTNNNNVGGISVKVNPPAGLDVQAVAEYTLEELMARIESEGSIWH